MFSQFHNCNSKFSCFIITAVVFHSIFIGLIKMWNVCACWCRFYRWQVAVVVTGAHLEYSQQLPVLELLELELLLELAVSGLVLLQHLDVLHGGPQDGALVLPHVLHQVMVPGPQIISLTTSRVELQTKVHEDFTITVY